MQTRDDFIMYEVRPALDVSEGTYDADAIFDELRDEGEMEFDPHDGYRYAEGHDPDAFWRAAWNHMTDE